MILVICFSLDWASHCRDEPRAGDKTSAVVVTSLFRVDGLGPGIKGLRELHNFELAKGMRTKDMELAHRQIFKPSVAKIQRCHDAVASLGSRAMAAVAVILATTAPSSLQTSTSRV